MDPLEDHFPAQSGGTFTRTWNRATSTSLQIRLVGAADHTAWLPLWEGHQCFYRTEIAAATSDATWQRFPDADGPMNTVLAWFDECAVGLVYWIYYRSCWTVGDYCYLQNLFITEGLCGEGTGRRLIEHVHAEAGAVDCSWVYWLIYESNSDAMKPYERIVDKSGFLQYRRIL